jgi:RNA 2',3'-cyclic 3'-phosphodiesterase
MEGTPVNLDRLHLSLHHLGDHKRLKPKLLYAARRAAEAVLIRQFEVTFSIIRSFEVTPPAGGRPHRHPLILLCQGEALPELHRILGAGMKKNGLRGAKHFTPHITLAYSPKLVLEQAIEPVRFFVRELVLIHSKLGLSQYHIVGRWPLHR